MKYPSSLSQFMLDIKRERDHQADKWADGTEEGLDQIDFENNSEMSFVGYIAYHATRWFPGGFPPYSLTTLSEFRTQMVKVATLAYAAIRWADNHIHAEGK